MLAKIRDDTLNVLNMQHKTQIRKDGIIQTSLWWYGKITGSAHMVEGDLHFRKPPPPPTTHTSPPPPPPQPTAMWRVSHEQT